MSFTEFYCDPTHASKSNFNAGSSTGATTVAATACTVSGLNIAAAAGTPWSGLSTGEWAAVYQNGVDTVAKAIGRVTAVNNGGADIDVAAWIGTPDEDEDRCIIDGVWQGPNGAVPFPFSIMNGNAKNAAGDVPRINLRNTAEYDMTADIVWNPGVGGPIVVQGYSSSPGDFGRAVIDGQASTTNYLFIVYLARSVLADLEFKNASAGDIGLFMNADGCQANRCVAQSNGGAGFHSDEICQYTECEAYGNTGNGFNQSSGTQTFERCISHNNAIGFALTLNTRAYKCISYDNGGDGYHLTGSATYAKTLWDCDAYNNTGDGVEVDTAATTLSFTNCNFVKNGGYGINLIAGCTGVFYNLGFGSGTQANTSGTINNGDFVEQIGTVTITADATPWNDPGNGDFRISHADCKGTGRGTYTQTEGGEAGTVGYPDIGAAQHQDSGLSNRGILTGGRM